MNLQQVNLYLPEFQPKQELVNARNSIIFLVLFIVFFVFLQISNLNTETQLEVKVKSLDQKSHHLKERLAILKKTPVGDDRARIEMKIARTRAAIENRNKIRAVMSGQSLGNEKGFSNFMEALSKYAVTGLYLEAFELTHGGKFASLKGLSKKPEYVPLYISRLQKDSIFSNTKFGSLSMNKRNRHVEFVLGGSDDVDTLFIKRKSSK